MRIARAAVRAWVRRKDWGDEPALVRRARRVFGAPLAYAWIVSRGIAREPVDDAASGVQGEWLRPASPRPGVVFYIHGGGYVSCSPATHRPIAAAFARFTRRTVFSVDYRLAPEHPFPAAHDDVIAAHRWLASLIGPDEPIVVAGDSAGGGLALALALAARDRGRKTPAALILFSPWTDLTGSSPSVTDNDRRDAMFRTENLRDFARAYLGDASPADPRASPLLADLHDLPPMLLSVGESELLLDDSRRVHEKLRSANGVSRLDVYRGVFHVWHMLGPLTPESTRALSEAATFAERHF